MRWRSRLKLRQLGSCYRGFARPVLVVVGLVVVLATVGYALTQHIVPAAIDHPYFALRSVTVSIDTDVAHTAPAALAGRAGLYRGTSIWRVDRRGAEAALRRPGWVRRARVIRRFPDSVRIALEYRLPLALTLLGAVPHLVADDGIPYAVPTTVALPDLPWVTGWERAASRGARLDLIRRAVSLATRAGRAGIRFSQVDCSGNGTLKAYLDSPELEIVFGRHFDPADSLARLALVFEHMSPAQLEAARYIDLSFDGRAVVRDGDRDIEPTVSAQPARRRPGRG